MNKKIISLLMTFVMMAGTIAPVSAKSVVIMNDIEEIVELGSVERTSTVHRATDTEIYEIGDKMYAYTAYSQDSLNKDQVLVVYDITDISNITEVARYTDIITKIKPDSMVIKDNYLFITQMNTTAGKTSGIKLIYYKIGEDGFLTEEGVLWEEDNKYNQRHSNLYIIDDYLFYALHHEKRYCVVFDVSDIENQGVVEVGRTEADQGVVAPIAEKISDDTYRVYYNAWYDNASGADTYEFVVNDMKVNSDGTVSFEKQYQGVPEGLSVVNYNEAALIGQGKIAIGQGSKLPRLVIDASDVSNVAVTEIPVVNSDERSQSAISINDRYYAIGSNANHVTIYDKMDNRAVKVMTRVAGASGGQVYGLHIYKNMLIVSAEAKVIIFDLCTTVSVEMSDIEEINDGILTVNADVDITENDTLILKAFGEALDITDKITDGKLECSQKTIAQDGDYTAELCVVRNGEVVLSEEKEFTVRKTMPIKLDMGSLDAGITALSVTAENVHNADSQEGILYLAVYNEDGSIDKIYSEELSSLVKNETEDFSITLDAAVEDGQAVRLFAVADTGRALSDVYSSGDYSFNTNDTNIPAVIENKVNLYAEIDPDTAVLRISGKSYEEFEADVFVEVYKPEPDNTTLDYINMFKTTADGSFYVEYPMTGAEEGKNYTIKAYTTGNEFLWGERAVSYYSQTTIDNALLAVKNSTSTTFTGVIKGEYKNVYALNTEIYDALESEYKIAVADAVSGKTYTDIAALNAEFDKVVLEQKAIMDRNNQIKAVLAQICSAGADGFEALITENDELLEIEFGDLYEELDDSMKEKLYKNWISNKRYTKASELQDAIYEGTAVEFIKLAQHTYITKENIIENNYEELGISESSKKKYSSKSSSAKTSIIKSFLKKNVSNYSSIASNFDSALNGYKEQTTTTGGSGGGGGGGSYYPATPNIVNTEIKPEDVIPEEMLNLEKKNNFGDVSVDNWYFEAVTALADKGIVEGITDNEFRPNVNVKREEFIKMLILAYNAVDYNAECSFTDTEKNRWYYSYVATANKMGLINGINESQFGLGIDITRQDLAKIVYGAMNVMGDKLQDSSADYADMSKVSDYAREGVLALSAAGIFAGYEDNTFRPTEKVTRAMAAQVIYRVLNYGE